MVDFQFYRPQANALEQLWSQYAQAKGSVGGAFEKAFTPGMMAGFEALQKKEAVKEQQAFQTSERLAAQKFAGDQAAKERAAGLMGKAVTAFGDVLETSMKTGAEKAKLQQERQDATVRSQTILQESGLFPDWAQRGAAIADPKTAGDLVNQRQRELKDEEERAIKQRDEDILKSQIDDAKKAIGRLAAIGVATPTEINNYNNLVNTRDPKEIRSVLETVGRLNVEAESRLGLIADFDEFIAKLKRDEKQGATLVSSEQEEPFRIARVRAELAAKKLKATGYMAQLSPELRRSAQDDLASAYLDMKIAMGMTGLKDPTFRRELGKQAPDLLQLEGSNVRYVNGRIGGASARQQAQFDSYVMDKLKSDVLLQNELRAIAGTDFEIDPATLIASMSGGAAPVVPGAAPDTVARVREAIMRRYDEVGANVLGLFGINANRVEVPTGYVDVANMTADQKAKFSADLNAAVGAFVQANGRVPTTAEGKAMMYERGYFDVNYIPPAGKKEAAAAAPVSTPAVAPATGEIKAKPAEAAAKPAQPVATTAEQKLVKAAGETRPGLVAAAGKTGKPLQKPVPQQTGTDWFYIPRRMGEIVTESDQLGPAARGISQATGQVVMGTLAEMFPTTSQAEKRYGYRRFIGEQTSPAALSAPSADNAKAMELVRKAIQERASLPYQPIEGAPEARGWFNYPYYRILPRGS